MDIAQDKIEPITGILLTQQKIHLARISRYYAIETCRLLLLARIDYINRRGVDAILIFCACRTITTTFILFTKQKNDKSIFA